MCDSASDSALSPGMRNHQPHGAPTKSVHLPSLPPASSSSVSGLTMATHSGGTTDLSATNGGPGFGVPAMLLGTLTSKLDPKSKELCLESARIKGDHDGKRLLELGWNPHTARDTIFSKRPMLSTLWERPDGSIPEPVFGAAAASSLRSSDAWKLYATDDDDGERTFGRGGPRAASPTAAYGNVLPRYLQPKPPREDDEYASPKKRIISGSPPRVASLAKQGKKKEDADAAAEKRREATLQVIEEDKKRRAALRAAAARRAHMKREERLNEAVNMVQAHLEWKMALGMVDAVRRHGAAITIQCAMRRKLARERAKKMQADKLKKRRAQYEKELGSLEVLFASADDTQDDLFGQSNMDASFRNGSGPPTPPTEHPFDSDGQLMSILREIDVAIHVVSDEALSLLFQRLRERGAQVAAERRKKREDARAKRQAATKPGGYDMSLLVEDDEYGKLLDELGRMLQDGEASHQVRVDAIRELLRKRAAQLAKLKAADQARLAAALRQRENDLLKKRSAIQARKDRAKALATERVNILNSKQARLDFALKRMNASMSSSKRPGTEGGGDASTVTADDDDETDTTGGEPEAAVVYNAEELAAMRKQFDLVDSDGSGDVSREEFVAFYPMVCTFDVDQKWCSDLFDELDVDGGGTLTFEEFVNVYALVQKREEAMRNPGEAARLAKIQKQLRHRAEQIAKIRSEEKAMRARFQREKQEEIERNRQRAIDAKTIRAHNKGQRGGERGGGSRSTSLPPSAVGSPRTLGLQPSASPKGSPLVPSIKASSPAATPRGGAAATGGPPPPPPVSRYRQQPAAPKSGAPTTSGRAAAGAPAAKK